MSLLVTGMLFNSLHFLIFFLVVVIIYFLLPFRMRWFFLLAASYYFYMCWKAEYAILLVISTLIDYCAGLKMASAKSASQKKRYLLVSIISNLGLLFSFKYFNFFNESLRTLLNSWNIMYNVPAFHALLPVGISFYTFQTMSYSIDVYRGEQQPERHFGMFALYVTFFPQLVAGPIERSTSLLPQFYECHAFDVKRAVHGLQLMLWGFFKKVVIADRLAWYVNAVYNQPEQFHGLPIFFATYAFAFQIFCDFSGYSDIAIGAAEVMGFRLMQNFKRPYFSKSIAEFWQRWHISLSTWFRDYLYIPLGGNRVTPARRDLNVFIVFVVSGLWHGANWTFLAWGALHGGYFLTAMRTARLRQRLTTRLHLDRWPQLLHGWRVFVTFHLVLLSWVFFRANSLSDAFLLLKNGFDLSAVMTQLLAFNPLQGIPINRYETVIALFVVSIMEIAHLMQHNGSVRARLSNQPRWLRWGAYYAVIVSILIFGVFFQTEFIYFQF